MCSASAKIVVCFGKMSAALKKTTNLTGLPVLQNARNRILKIYSKIFKELQKIPESSAYRRHTEQLINHRKSILETESSIAEVEKKIGCGQIEEIMVQAQNELELARKFQIWKVWDPLKVTPPPKQWNWPAN